MPGMVLEGVVTNIVTFGAFGDVGVHQDGLVHLSQMADRYIRDPNEAVKVGQTVKVTVQSVDRARGRIALSMKSEPGASGGSASRPSAGRPTTGKPSAGKPVAVTLFEPRKGAVAPNGIRFT